MEEKTNIIQQEQKQSNIINQCYDCRHAQTSVSHKPCRNCENYSNYKKNDKTK